MNMNTRIRYRKKVFGGLLITENLLPKNDNETVVVSEWTEYRYESDFDWNMYVGVEFVDNIPILFVTPEFICTKPNWGVNYEYTKLKSCFYFDTKYWWDNLRYAKQQYENVLYKVDFTINRFQSGITLRAKITKIK